MLRLCITNLHTFQHGHPGYLVVHQKALGLNEESYFYELYFLCLQNDKLWKNMLGFRLIFSQNYLKTFVDICLSRCCAAPLFIQVSVRDSPHVSGPAAVGIILWTFSALSETLMPLKNEPFAHFIVHMSSCNFTIRLGVNIKTLL